MSQKVVLASNNNGKVAEMAAIFAEFDFDVVPQSEFGVDSADETGATFIENALIKARHACEKTGLPAIADDSGLVVAALNGEPGVHSARFAGEHGDDTKNIDRLLEQLGETAHANRQAYFVSALACLKHPDDPSPLVGQGRWHGQILQDRLGEGGFGYDPVFYVPTHQCSAAQLDAEIKNQISHRAMALQQLRQEIPHWLDLK